MNKSELFLEELDNNLGNISAACKLVNISRKQVLQFAQNNVDFQNKLWEIKEGFIDLAVSTQLKLGIAGDSSALKEYLYAHAKERGYGNSENLKPMYPGIKEPEKKEPEKEIKEQIKNFSTEKLEIALKKLLK